MMTLKGAKRVAIAIVGGTVLLLGVALIVLPGPAFVVIPAGLAILATEFAWARLWLKKIKSMIPAKKVATDVSPALPRRSRLVSRQTGNASA